MATIRIKRAYENPSPDDGTRILVDRVWPRGLTKEDLALSAWMRDVAPSTDLRRWFGHQVERWEEFRRCYKTELAARPDLLAPLAEAAARGQLTLVYGARDTAHNQAVVLREALEEILAGPERQRP